jgi:hypothetical protein
MTQEIQKFTKRMFLQCGGKEFIIDDEECEKIDNILGKGTTSGFIRLKGGEWVNIARINYIASRKSQEPKIWGEDIKI